MTVIVLHIHCPRQILARTTSIWRQDAVGRPQNRVIIEIISCVLKKAVWKWTRKASI